jgi:hypothetical protein
MVAMLATTATLTAVSLANTSSASGGRAETPFTASTGVPGGGGAGRSGGDANGGGGLSGLNCIGSPYPMQFYRTNGEVFSSVLDPDSSPEQFPDGTEQYWQVDCYDGCPSGWSPSEFLFNGCGAWRVLGDSPAVSVDDLVPGARDEAVGYIGLPVVALAPPVAQGGLVHVPMWLAVEPAGPFSARAQVGSVWAQVDASLSGLSWDMGTGDEPVECEGPGTIFTPGDTSGGTGGPGGEWPLSPDCGFTYEAASFPEFTPDGASAYHVAVTAHWALRLTGSDGRDVALDSVDVPFTFDYVVHELQTVGVAD